jgi:hypothetical protein
MQSLDIFARRGATGETRATCPQNAQRSAHSPAQGAQILIDDDPPRPTRRPVTLPALPSTTQTVSDNILG